MNRIYVIVLIGILAAATMFHSNGHAKNMTMALENSKAMFYSQFKDICFLAEEGDEPPYESHSIKAKRYDGQDINLFLVGYLCDRAAYNTTGAWFLTDSYGATSALTFATPKVKFNYSDDELRNLKSWRIQGMQASRIATGSTFDPKSKSISSFHKWRGLGDAHQSARYDLIEGRFVLVRFEVDPTYDEEINAITILNYPGPLQ